MIMLQSVFHLSLKGNECETPPSTLHPPPYHLQETRGPGLDVWYLVSRDAIQERSLGARLGRWPRTERRAPQPCCITASTYRGKPGVTMMGWGRINQGREEQTTAATNTITITFHIAFLTSRAALIPIVSSDCP